MPSTPHLNTKPHALVTGATGFIGSHLVESLVQKNYDVFCIVRKTSDLSLLKNLPCTLIDGDITDRNSLIDAVRDKDI
ncbi:MAG TPA: NAD-dependent epimerase/dehydratase family protein, partial [bacterium]|nr:NAD-dependent epimerase/dehydratase family protein [bacterium]